jgi:hypothetical protein
VVGPLGTFIAEPVWDKEEIVFADLNMDDLVESRVCGNLHIWQLLS